VLSTYLYFCPKSFFKYAKIARKIAKKRSGISTKIRQKYDDNQKKKQAQNKRTVGGFYSQFNQKYN